jgi:chorismate dehydratase
MKCKYKGFYKSNTMNCISPIFANQTPEMDPLKISAVSYLNTIPFVYGIRNSGYLEDFRLDLAVPCVCTSNLKTGKSDIALIPVGSIPLLNGIQYVTNYCIGAVSPVKTVLLLSHQPLTSISKIHLDWDSRTSVRLAKVLANKFWKIDPEWISLKSGEAERSKGIESLVAIGDKTFELVNHYEYVYDLAEEWIKFTSLPFVFAAWVSTKKLPDVTLEKFNKALEFGINHKPETIEFFKDSIPPGIDAAKYLNENISFEFDEEKKKGLDLFLSYLKEMK